MTQQYLAGELSLLLAQVQAVTADEASARAAHALRQEAETQPIAALTSVTLRALALVDTLCWASLSHGDAAGFHRQAGLGVDLREFGVCAGWLP